MRRDEDRHASVMVAAPVANEVSGASAGDHGTGRHQLVEHRLAWFIARPEAADVFSAIAQPLVQPVPFGTKRIVLRVPAAGHVVKGHGHVQHEPAHRSAPFRADVLTR
jgi:hypothetical protein